MPRLSAPRTREASAVWWCSVFLAFVGLGALEALVAVLEHRESSGIASTLSGAGLVFGLWLLAAGPLAFASYPVVRALFGRGFLALRFCRFRLARLRHPLPGPGEIRLVARILGSFISALALVVGSVAWVSHLVSTRHGALLIAAAVVLGQLGLLLAAGILGSFLSRQLVGLMGTRRPRWLSARSLVVAIFVVVTTAAVAAVVTTWPLFQLAQGPALFGASGALLCPLLARAFIASAPRVWSRPAVFALLALLLVFASALRRGASGYVLGASGVAKYAYAGLLRLSDLDRDGSPSFPSLDDCAPWDRARHPFALEVPGNGIDEDCDGEDRLTIFEAPPRPPFVRPDGASPNLILVTLDAARADHFGFMGYERPTSPNLDALARRSVVFERAFSQDSGTGPSLWSLFAGKTPFQVHLLEPQRFPPIIGPGEQLLAELLREAGYETEAVVCGYVFDTAHWNLRRGFDRFRNVCSRSDAGLAATVSARAIAALRELRKVEPFFLWVHYYDTHDPYTPHPEYGFGSDKVAHYDEELRFIDTHFQELYTEIRQASGARPLYLAVSADHGEGFGEHGPAPHARTLYREVTHVPLLIEGPALAIRRIRAPVSLADLYPTLLELARVPVPQGTTMTSQVPVLFGAAEDPFRIVFQESSYSRPRRDKKGAIFGRHHSILDVETQYLELYDFERDPLERENLAGRGLPEELLLRRALKQFVPTTYVPPELSG